MADSRFFKKSGPFSLAEIAKLTATESNDAQSELMLADVAALDVATEGHLSFLDNPKYRDQFAATTASACFVHPKYAELAPQGLALLISEDPYRAYAKAAQLFYPATPSNGTIAKTAVVEESAQLGANAQIGAGAYIGANAELGDNSIIGPNAVIEDSVKIGDDCYIGANTTISHAVIGNHVRIHRGVHIGQDGFGFAMGAEGHEKVPQLGRVVIHDHVEIGSGACIDRGTGPDTQIGLGVKIDNLVQIAHNVQLGRGVVVVAQVGISGSTRVDDFAILAGQVGVAGHLHIGAGAQVAAQSGVISDVPAGKAFGGYPAQPIKDWHRQSVALRRLTTKK